MICASGKSRLMSTNRSVNPKRGETPPFKLLELVNSSACLLLLPDECKLVCETQGYEDTCKCKLSLLRTNIISHRGAHGAELNTLNSLSTEGHSLLGLAEIVCFRGEIS